MLAKDGAGRGKLPDRQAAMAAWPSESPVKGC